MPTNRDPIAIDEKILETASKLSLHKKIDITKLTETQRAIFFLLSTIIPPQHLPEILAKLNELDPNWINYSSPESFKGQTALMYALETGNFLYVHHLLESSDKIEITHDKIKNTNVLFYIAISSHQLSYRSKEDLREKLAEIFLGSQSIEEDELQIFQRLYDLCDWDKEMNNESKISLMASLFLNNKKLLINFLEQKGFFSSLTQINIREKILLIDGLYSDGEKDASNFIKKVSLTQKEVQLVEKILRDNEGGRQYALKEIIKIAQELADQGGDSKSHQELASTILELASTLHLRQRRRGKEPKQETVEFLRSRGYDVKSYDGPMTIDEITDGAGPAISKKQLEEFRRESERRRLDAIIQKLEAADLNATKPQPRHEEASGGRPDEHLRQFAQIAATDYERRAAEEKAKNKYQEQFDAMMAEQEALLKKQSEEPNAPSPETLKKVRQVAEEMSMLGVNLEISEPSPSSAPAPVKTSAKDKGKEPMNTPKTEVNSL